MTELKSPGLALPGPHPGARPGVGARRQAPVLLYMCGSSMWVGGQPASDMSLELRGGSGGGVGVKWLDPDIVACLDGLDTKLYGDREQWV